uniref:Acetyl-CoA acetyltransferase1-like isoform X2 n=1 Tax=Rhizophora mucronata TaxID=61149 RepID=A0A2P2MCL0_RHIMU
MCLIPSLAWVRTSYKFVTLPRKAPELFTTTPAIAIPKAISNAGLEASQIEYYEINEAFSVSYLCTASGML